MPIPSVVCSSMLNVLFMRTQVALLVNLWTQNYYYSSLTNLPIIVVVVVTFWPQTNDESQQKQRKKNISKWSIKSKHIWRLAFIDQPKKQKNVSTINWNRIRTHFITHWITSSRCRCRFNAHEFRTANSIPSLLRCHMEHSRQPRLSHSNHLHFNHVQRNLSSTLGCTATTTMTRNKIKINEKNQIERATASNLKSF